MVGGPQIRNAGTIGGNTCNGVTSADSASTLFAWEAIIELTGKNGKRYLPIKDFYLKAGTVDINVAEGEIQTAILIPKASYDGTAGLLYQVRDAKRDGHRDDRLLRSTAALSADKTDVSSVCASPTAWPVLSPCACRARKRRSTERQSTMENIEAFSGNGSGGHPSHVIRWRASKAFRQHIAVEMAEALPDRIGQTLQEVIV